MRTSGNPAGSSATMQMFDSSGEFIPYSYCVSVLVESFPFRVIPILKKKWVTPMRETKDLI
jgi:hypothetical protein